MAKKDYLPLYAARFNTVELDYTYYSMPMAANLAKMLVGGPAHVVTAPFFVYPAAWTERQGMVGV
jgi:hypothetical protein